MSQPIIDLKKTGANIVALRTARGVDVKTIARELHLASLNAVYRWQRGECLPDLQNLCLLANLLGCARRIMITTVP